MPTCSATTEIFCSVVLNRLAARWMRCVLIKSVRVVPVSYLNRLERYDGLI